MANPINPFNPPINQPNLAKNNNMNYPSAPINQPRPYVPPALNVVNPPLVVGNVNNIHIGDGIPIQEVNVR